MQQLQQEKHLCENGGKRGPVNKEVMEFLADTGRQYGQVSQGFTFSRTFIGLKLLHGTMATLGGQLGWAPKEH